MTRAQLAVVSPPDATSETSRATALQFSETVRTVVGLSRRGRLVAPVFRSPPALEGIDRTIRRRGHKPPVVAIAREGRPLAAVQSDVIEAVVVANGLDERRADRFRRAAWARLQDAVPSNYGGSRCGTPAGEASIDLRAPRAGGEPDPSPGVLTSGVDRAAC